jgi:hypothetical protein
MVVTVVLHLLAAQLESGELVGHAEDVATGIRYPVRSSADVIALCRQAAQSPEFGSDSTADREHAVEWGARD